MDGTSLTPEQEKLNALRELLPEAFSEGKIDWEKLKATLGENINFSNERYVLNWAGKSDAFKVLQKPTTKTLIPAKEESVNFDKTENIFIEGENLEVLKVLQKSYFGKVKMIYIDPPYNTGNDSFIYPDKFSESKADYEKRVGDKDEEGYITKDGMFKKNSKENGQYHSNWLNMMMPRLYLAKNLLRQDGVIFISIDDNEVHNLRLLMNEIFGEENFVASICHKSRASISNDKIISTNHNHLLLYSKNQTLLFEDRLQFGIQPDFSSFNKIDDRGNKYKLTPVDGPGGALKGNPYYEFEGILGYWRYSKEKMQELFNKGEIIVTKNNLQRKSYLENAIGKRQTVSTWWDDGFLTSNATRELESLMGDKLFDNPKSINLLTRCLDISTKSDDIILDFFAGSGTTAHAVMELNKEDGGNRKYICVQLPELCDEKSEAYKAGYKTIADISKERIRRAGKKIQAEIEEEKKKKAGQLNFENQENQDNPKNQGSDIDLGFKVLKLSDSNFKQWQQIEGKDAKVLAEQMKLFVDPVSESATIENMVYELLLKSGKDLNSRIEKKGSFYKINGNELILLLEKATQEIIDTVLAEKPIKVIALDKLFKGNDQLKTNTVLQMKDAGIEFKTI